MNRISLTSSMRSNLLNLQNISRQVSSTQNKLATGNKVNSAIDNPGSYYTARSLNNRADDLNALLDSMGQAVSTIKAATTALETGASLLEQATAVATDALENAVPAKSYFADKGTVVTTAQELKDAVAAGTETIIVYGQINLDFALQLKEGQKLVGTEYFTGYTGKQRFSCLTSSKSNMLELNSGTIVSDLDLIQNYNVISGKMINAANKTDITLKNLSLSTQKIDFMIQFDASDDIKILGHIKFEQKEKANHALALYNTGKYSRDQMNITIDAILESNLDSPLVMVRNQDSEYNGNIHTTIKQGSVLKSKNDLVLIVGSHTDKDEVNELILEQGVTIENGRHSLTSAEEIQYISDTRANIVYFSNLLADPLYTPNTPPQPEKLPTADNSRQQYSSILTQYDQLIKDASYKGINLLQEDQLGVKFNESGSAALKVKGKDMSSAALGLQMMDWQTQGEIAQSLSEISAALKSIRSFSAELGNNYSIITGRQDFTENLINILTEGADKLTLADMNEESANMLALQTRQQLAINSLSLASQTSQAVLKLF